jgi:hypothetical protein
MGLQEDGSGVVALRSDRGGTFGSCRLMSGRLLGSRKVSGHGFGLLEEQ